MKTVIGLDLSLTATGIATPDGVKTVTTKAAAGVSLIGRCLRLQNVLNHVIAEVARAHDDDIGTLLVIEAPAFSRTTGHQHDRSGLWWLVVHEFATWEYLDIVEVAPTARAKYATGKGNASKDTVLAAVVRRYSDVEVTNNNEADSLVLRAMGRRAIGSPIDDLPQTHLKAMDAVRWPESIRC